MFLLSKRANQIYRWASLGESDVRNFLRIAEIYPDSFTVTSHLKCTSTIGQQFKGTFLKVLKTSTQIG